MAYRLRFLSAYNRALKVQSELAKNYQKAFYLGIIYERRAKDI